MAAGAVSPFWNTAVTRPRFAAASTTWLLVSRRPSVLSTSADPSPDEPTPSTRSCTTPGSTRSATASTAPAGSAASSTDGSGTPSTPMEPPVVLLLSASE
jgi:hypothetical protein